MVKWIVSILITVLIWGAGAAGFAFIKAKNSSELKMASSIIQEETASAAPASQNPKSVKDIIDMSQKKVYSIKLPDGSLGSGFLCNNKGDIITNGHVVAGASEVKVITEDSREMDGEVIGYGDETDVALVRVEELKGKEPLQLETSKKAEVGDEVLALGSPLGLQNTVTDGIISGADRTLNIDNYTYDGVYQISAPIAPGNSGGPLISKRTGKVLGINSAGTDQGSIGFSIPIYKIIKKVNNWSKEAF